MQGTGGIQRSSRLGFPKAGQQRVIPKLSGASWEHLVCRKLGRVSYFQEFLISTACLCFVFFTKEQVVFACICMILHVCEH